MHDRTLLLFLQYLQLLARNTVHGLSLVDCLISQPSSVGRERDDLINPSAHNSEFVLWCAYGHKKTFIRGKTHLLAIEVGHNVLHTLEPGVGTVLPDPVIELAVHHFQRSGVATGDGRVSKREEGGAYAGANEVTKSCNMYVSDWA